MAEQLAELLKGDKNPFTGIFKTKDFSKAVTAGVTGTVDISFAGYTPISIICTNGVAHKFPPLIYNSNNNVYVGCDSTATVTFRVIYIKNGILDN